MIIEKECTKCHVIKPLTEFYPNKFNKKDGHRYKCKKCELTPPMEYKEVKERLCSKCGLVKPISEFSSFRLNAIGHNTTCRSCMKVNNNKNSLLYLSNNTPEKIKQLEDSGATKICKNCNIDKPLTQFNLRRYNKDGHASYCRECDKDTKKLKFHNKKELTEEEYIKWRLKINDKCRVEKQHLKHEVFSHYCENGIVKCANPYHVHTEEFTDLDILTIDHINSDGYKEVDKYGNRTGGVTFYRKLKRLNYPDGFQILCANCQFKKKIINNEYGEFSHKVKPLKNNT